MTSTEIVSIEPATGAIFWRGPIGDPDQEVEIARRSWAEWAAKPVTVRIEALRRFVNVVRGKAEALTDCIARETGKPLWEARTEVESVINKVEISIDYITSQGNKLLLTTASEAQASVVRLAKRRLRISAGAANNVGSAGAQP